MLFIMKEIAEYGLPALVEAKLYPIAVIEVGLATLVRAVSDAHCLSVGVIQKYGESIAVTMANG
jgi:hypothetical protein